MHLPRFLSVVICAATLVTATYDSCWTPCQNPSVRKEWRKLSKKEKKDWLKAVKCLGQQQHDPNLVATMNATDIPPINPKTSYYDDLVYMHMDLNHKIHATGWFFPWHRWYVHIAEEAMKTKCGYNGAMPYWDWTQDTGDFKHATIFDSDPDSGLGTWGVAKDDFQIRDGALGSNAQQPFKLGYPVKHGIRRNYTERPYINFPMQYLLKDPYLRANETFTKAIVDKSVNGFVGDFTGFQKYFQDYQGPHAGVHLIVGADLTGTCPGNAPKTCQGGETWSPNDPLFFLHHSMVDKVWSDWQNNNRQNFWAFEGGEVQSLSSLALYNKYPLGTPPLLDFSSVLPTENLFPNGARILDVMDTQGGFLCYKYQ
ncbi:Di-copper centre-containing protein [Pluteus cervinus]|uniref:Di-copper centre-containing protein n=1 Tax=Pluteus cervinus TaxID=181527 RepID=A0ACD3AUA0_9AGAR|nr:Di-copper centre-containing protein [Pluteus cervinus]